MNWTDVIFFHAEITPEKLAIVAHGAVCPYGRLAHGIVSTQRRLEAAGVTAGQTAALHIGHPIDHFIAACALYRLKVATASINSAPEAYLDHVPFDLVLTDTMNPVVGLKQPSAKIFLLDTSWFKDQVTFSVAERTSAASNLDWTCRVNCFPGEARLPRAVKTTARSLEAQVVTYAMSAFPDWERMISIAPLETPAGFLAGITALWHGRTVLFANSGSARGLTTLHQYHYFVGTTRELEALLTLQETGYAPMRPLRGAWIEGRQFTPTLLDKCLATISSNTILSYSHPQIGIIAYGGAARLKEVPGAAGFVAPWTEVEAVDDGLSPLPKGREGELRFRNRDTGASPTNEGAARDEWIYPGQRGRITTNNLLVIS